MPVSATVATHETPETPDPIVFPGDADPGGRDTVSATVAGAVANAEARYGELAGDTYGLGSTIGDVMTLPEVPSDHSKHTGSPQSADSGPAG
jgi:hypothetical protein